jgi:hypothetical protein
LNGEFFGSGCLDKGRSIGFGATFAGIPIKFSSKKVIDISMTWNARFGVIFWMKETNRYPRIGKFVHFRDVKWRGFQRPSDTEAGLSARNLKRRRS